MFENQNFREDLDILFEKIKRGHIGFSRFGDGEMAIIKKQYINLLNKDNGEFMYSPKEERYQKPYNLLRKSLNKQMENYYVGISCPCCVGMKKHLEMLTVCEQEEGKVTWANLFVNSNYFYFLNKIVTHLRDKKVFLISNEKSNLSKFPLKIEKHYPVGTNSWINDLDLIDKIKEDISSKDIEDSYFLFCAAPLSNIACCELFEYSSVNTFLDCGSIFDDLLGLGKTRGYLRGANTLRKECIWSKKC